MPNLNNVTIFNYVQPLADRIAYQLNKQELGNLSKARKRDFSKTDWAKYTNPFRDVVPNERWLMTKIDEGYEFWLMSPQLDMIANTESPLRKNSAAPPRQGSLFAVLFVVNEGRLIRVSDMLLKMHGKYDTAENSSYPYLGKQQCPDHLTEEWNNHLSTTVGNGDLYLASWLVNRGADPPTNAWNTYFSVSVGNGNLPLVKWLVDQKVDPPAEEWKRLLSTAISNGHLFMAKWLMSQGIDFSKQRWSKQLAHAIQDHGRHCAAVEWMEGRGVAPNKNGLLERLCVRYEPSEALIKWVEEFSTVQGPDSSRTLQEVPNIFENRASDVSQLLREGAKIRPRIVLLSLLCKRYGENDEQFASQAKEYTTAELESFAMFEDLPDIPSIVFKKLSQDQISIECEQGDLVNAPTILLRLRCGIYRMKSEHEPEKPFTMTDVSKSDLEFIVHYISNPPKKVNWDLLPDPDDGVFDAANEYDIPIPELDPVVHEYVPGYPEHWKYVEWCK